MSDTPYEAAMKATYLVMLDDRVLDGHMMARKGDIVENCGRDAFGIARSDSIRTGIQHLSVRHPAAGSGFTVPFTMVRPRVDGDAPIPERKLREVTQEQARLLASANARHQMMAEAGRVQAVAQFPAGSAAERHALECVALIGQLGRLLKSGGAAWPTRHDQ